MRIALRRFGSFRVRGSDLWNQRFRQCYSILFHDTPSYSMMLYCSWSHAIPYYSRDCTSRYSMLFHETLFLTIPCYSLLFHDIPCYSMIIYSKLFLTIPRYSMLFHDTLFQALPYYSTIFHDTLFQAIPYYSTICHSILWYSIPFYSLLSQGNDVALFMLHASKCTMRIRCG